MANLELAVNWLKNTVDARLRMHVGKTGRFDPGPLEFYSDPSGLSRFLEEHQPDFDGLFF
jgi:hypothetical protein